MKELNINPEPRKKARKPKLKIVAELELSPNELTSSEILRYTSMLNTSWIAVSKNLNGNCQVHPVPASKNKAEEDEHEVA